MSLYAPGILVLLIQLGFAAHVIRSGRSYIWILPIMFLPLVGCIAYLVIAILPDMPRSNTARRLADDMVNTVAPGGGFENDPAMLHGLARAKLLAADGAGAQASYERLKAADPVAFSAEAELDYARALALQGKNDEAVLQYEKVLPKYPGEEARCRYALLLLKLGQKERAQRVFREIVESVRGAPSYYRSRQREWLKIARQNLS